MAVDNTPPRLRLIVTIAVITVVTLVSLDFVFKSYYGMMTEEAGREKTAPTKDKEEQTKAEATAFSQGAVPLAQAMAQIGKGTRPDTITAQPSEDLGPMTGWSKLPKPAPVPQPKGQDPSPALAAGDGGVPLAGDGGAPTGDAGAPAADGGAHHGRHRRDGGAGHGGAGGGDHP